MTLQLYGVVRAGHPRAPRTVCWEDLAMVVGEAPAQPDPAVHLAVVSALVEGGPVLPVRFGTVAEDEDAVRADVLAPAAGTYRADLDRLDGLAEVHVCLRFTEPGSAWRATRSDVLLSEVAERARDSVSLPAGESADERWAFLVGLGDLLVVRDAVTGLDGGGEVRAEWVGPLPAYSFLDRRTCSRWSW
ncbi:gas vesicle protein GvpFL [Amycolatopsis balhimycina DSM 5908]|uniref:Gas vesicle protein GvpFL n=1 Tax=Amycolatopsis balhimycina DSM 5908 TaxID=1081091 RepID=A0A428W8S4_AMYBA|nr:GvpL/GvpF family gas vesicle protein [Amycolatopsis balhimycina]RSM39499.1 gas vesicle protein GvpFL [Amycolatopsis balhimycina DSM 5908]